MLKESVLSYNEIKAAAWWQGAFLRPTRLEQRSGHYRTILDLIALNQTLPELTGSDWTKLNRTRNNQVGRLGYPDQTGQITCPVLSVLSNRLTITMLGAKLP